MCPLHIQLYMPHYELLPCSAVVGNAQRKEASLSHKRYSLNSSCTPENVSVQGRRSFFENTAISCWGSGLFREHELNKELTWHLVAHEWVGDIDWLLAVQWEDEPVNEQTRSLESVTSWADLVSAVDSIVWQYTCSINMKLTLLCGWDSWLLGPFYGAIAVPSDSCNTWWMAMRQLAVANGPNIFQMLLVVESGWIFMPWLDKRRWCVHKWVSGQFLAAVQCHKVGWK